jgi:hypothetical protein
MNKHKFLINHVRKVISNNFTNGAMGNQKEKAKKNDDIKELNEDLNRLGNDWRVDVNQQEESKEVKHKDEVCKNKSEQDSKKENSNKA